MNAPAPVRWNIVVIALHWLSAILILALLAVGFFMTSATLGAATQFDLYQWHKTFGFVLLLLTVMRVFARTLTASPAPPADMAPWERRAAGATHFAFYAVLLIVAFAGWLRVSSAIIPIPINFFGLTKIPNLVGPDEAFSERMAFFHEASAWLLLALLALHTAAALKHHYFNEDNVLTRMVGTAPRASRRH
jgi:cytochrome b561